MSDFLEQKRNQIDELDRSILITLKKRLSLMPEIAKFKIEQGLPIFQTERENTLIKEKKALAKEFGLNEDFIIDLFRAIMTESKRIQEENQ